jgi:enterochelin esterase-like enzyme
MLYHKGICRKEPIVETAGKHHHYLPNVTLLMAVSLIIVTACGNRQATPAVYAVPSSSPPSRPGATETGPGAAAKSSPTSITGPVVIESFQDLRSVFMEIRAAPPAEAQARANQVWQILVESKREPLILGTQVIFFYKGEADQVNWSGSFNKWSTPGLAGTRVAQTDLWAAYTELPVASRAEYKIILNAKDWILDPANPSTTFSGLIGDNNVVTLPGFSVTDVSKKRSDVPHGTLTASLSTNSHSMGYTVNYWIYMPAGYESLGNLPVIYVLDGNDFIDERMGALPDILDNMIADGRIKPVLAVFIDAREPGNPQHNRREEEFLVHPVEHARFIADELVPVVDSTFRTDPHPEARVTMGVSYGGLSAYYIAASQFSVFHNLAAFSPSLWVLDSPQYVADPQQLEGSQKSWLL